MQQPREVVERIDAELRASWGDPEALSPAFRRRYEIERGVRFGLKGDEPALWVLRDIRSGEWERRTKRNMRNLLRDKAKLARWKRDGYWFDAERRLRAPVHVENAPRRSATTSRARPQGRRATARAAAASGDDGPLPPADDEPPGLAVTPIAVFRRELLHRLGGSR